MVIAVDRKQARTIMRYVKGLLSSVPMLAKIIEDSTRETINLQNRVTIEVHTASFRSTRGYTIVAALCDELAFWATRGCGRTRLRGHQRHSSWNGNDPRCDVVVCQLSLCAQRCTVGYPSQTFRQGG